MEKDAYEFKTKLSPSNFRTRSRSMSFDTDGTPRFGSRDSPLSSLKYGT